MVRRECPTFFLICHAARASGESRAGRHPVGFADRRAIRALPPPPPSPSVGGGKAMLPSVEPVGIESQFLGDHFSGLTALKPVQDRFTFECFVEFAADFDRCLVHGLDDSLFTQFSVRQFEATSDTS